MSMCDFGYGLARVGRWAMRHLVCDIKRSAILPAENSAFLFDHAGAALLFIATKSILRTYLKRPLPLRTEWYMSTWYRVPGTVFFVLFVWVGAGWVMG